jgi:hypothetical protein
LLDLDQDAGPLELMYSEAVPRSRFDGWAGVAFLGFEDVLVLYTAETDRTNGSLRGQLACSRENESCPTVRQRPGRGPIPRTRLDRRLQRLAAATHWSRYALALVYGSFMAELDTVDSPTVGGWRAHR